MFLKKPDAKLRRGFGVWGRSAHRVDVGAGEVVCSGGGGHVGGGTRACGLEGAARGGGKGCEL